MAFRDDCAHGDPRGSGHQDQERMLRLEEVVQDAIRPTRVPVPGVGHSDTAGKQYPGHLEKDSIDLHSFSHRLHNLVEFAPFRGTPKKENTMFVVKVFCLKASLALPAAAGDSFAQSGTHEVFTIVE